MHRQALEYVARHTNGRHYRTVVEFGSRDVNGSPRTVIGADRYIGVDLVGGNGVDYVADAATWKLVEGRRSGLGTVDLVVCCEVLEHTPYVEDIIANAARHLEPGGKLIVTCAADPRLPHSAVDGARLRPGEHYENLTGDRLLRACGKAGLRHHDIQRVVHPNHGGDLYLTAAKDARADR
jgi:SAM-dependent methyltransferase